MYFLGSLIYLSKWKLESGICRRKFFDVLKEVNIISRKHLHGSQIIKISHKNWTGVWGLLCSWKTGVLLYLSFTIAVDFRSCNHYILPSSFEMMKFAWEINLLNWTHSRIENRICSKFSVCLPGFLGLASLCLLS